MQNLKLLDYTKKRLDGMYLVIYAIKNNINIKKAKVDVYTLVGVNRKGLRDLVGIYQDRPLNNRYWLDIFESLKSRGLNEVLFLAVDDNKNLKRTAKIAFPMINFVDSLTFVISKFDKYTSEKYARKVASRLYKLYSQTTLNKFKNEFNCFKENYNNAIHQKLITKYLSNLEGYYKYSANIRNLLFKPSANTRIYDRIRLSFKSNENYIMDLNEIYGIDISKDQVAKFADTITTTVEKWLSRPLKKLYVFTYANCLYIPVMNELKSEKKAFYIIIGVDVNWIKDILGIWCDKTESATFWTSVFEDIKARGVEDILYTTSDGIAGFKGSLETVFPKTQAQRCVVHLARNLYKICPQKQASQVMQGFKTIYSASCLEIAQIELENFKKKFTDMPKVITKVEEYMQYIDPLFELPYEIRKAIYTSNSIESVNSALRKVTNGEGSFSSEESVYKVLYLRVQELQKKWKRPIPNWNKISIQLAELFGERYTKYLDI